MIVLNVFATVCGEIEALLFLIGRLLGLLANAGRIRRCRLDLMSRCRLAMAPGLELLLWLDSGLLTFIEWLW